MNFDMKVGSIAQRDLLICDITTRINDAASLMLQHGCTSILVKKADEIVGIWTEADALQLNFADPDISRLPVERVMSSPVVSVGADASIAQVVETFRRKGIRRCLVEYKDTPHYGIISQSDITLNIDVDHFLTLYKVGAVCEPVVRLNLHSDIATAVMTMRSAKQDAAILLNDQQQAVGIITQSDLLKILASGANNSAIEDIGCKQLIGVQEDDSLLYARQLLQEHHIRHLIVWSKAGEVSGLLSMRQTIQFLQMEYSAQLREALAQRDDALRRSKQNLHLAEQVIEHAQEGIIITDRQGVVMRVNPAFSQLTGYQEADIVGNEMSLLSSGHHPKAFYRKMWQALMQKGVWTGEIWNRKKNGELFLEWLTITAIYDDTDNVCNYTGLFRDITEDRRHEEQIRQLAYFDELTKLPNRRLFNDRLGMAIASAKRHQKKLAIMFIDIDHFKRINDTLGHNAGDWILKELANRLKGLIRIEDTLARLGGDEFVMLLPSIDDYLDIEVLGHRVAAAIKQPFHYKGETLHITVSIGTSLYPNDGHSVEDLLKHADTAMYSVKSNGRNGLQHFHEDMARQSKHLLELESRLGRAIENNELEVYYQPKVNVTDQSLTGLEALLRWKNPDLGNVSPAQFIPVAEEIGLIENLELWVLEQVCKQLNTWQKSAVKLIPIAVNVSPVRLRYRDLANQVITVLDHFQISPQYLQLEITESAFIEDIETVAEQLQQIRDTGVSISLDDFGTGYSSLSYLPKLPLDELKIDASFIRKIPDCGISDKIIKAIIAMAQSLEIDVVVEGVETELQLRYVRNLGCNIIQGYLTGKPAPALVIEPLLQSSGKKATASA